MHDTLISPQLARELTSLAYFLSAGLAGYCAWRIPPALPGQPSPIASPYWLGVGDPRRNETSLGHLNLRLWL